LRYALAGEQEMAVNTFTSSTEAHQTTWQAAEAYQRRLQALCEPPPGQALDPSALAAAAKELPQLLSALQAAGGDGLEPRPAEQYPVAETLRASEARYRDLFENSPVSLWEEDFTEVRVFLDGLRREGVIDLQAYLMANPQVVLAGMRRIKVLDVNQATLKLYGARTKEELLTRVDQILGPATYPMIVTELLAIERGAAEFEALGVNYRLSGEPIEVALQWFIPGLQQDNLTRLIVAIEDVTQQRLAEAALRESETRFRTYIEHSPEGVFVTDQTGRYLEANRAACEMVGYARDELLALSIPDLLPPADDRHEARVRQLSTGGTLSETLQLRRKDGTTVPVSLNAVRLPDNTQLAFCTDITERQRAEESLRASEERYRVLAESLPDLIYILDRQHRVQYINALAAARFRRQPQEIIGLPQAALFPADTAQFHDASTAQVFATGQPLNSEDHLPLPAGDIWIDNRLMPLRDASGDIVAVLGISRDVTDRKAMEQALQEERASLARRVTERTAELNATNAELVRAMRAKDDFLATMSHELRTPLTGILGLSESLQMDTYGPLNDKQVRSLQMIHASGEHLLALITDVLDLAKIGADKLELQQEWLAPEEVCQASLRLIQPQATKKRIRLTSRFDNAANNLWADARRLKQMLLNLLGNAVKFTPEGGTIGLEVSAEAERQRMLFAVWDTGIGISAADLKQLFQPFMQVDSSLSRRYEGAGLGLALVRRLAELHGGGVIAESHEGQGSRFTIVLPWNPSNRPAGWEAALLAEAEPWPARLAGMSPEPGAAGPEPPDKLVLLAEDNDLLARTFADALQAHGYQVLIARDGIEALELAQLRRPALILMDIQMPGLDGLEAIRRLRAAPDFSHTPVIALTALTMPGDRERCLTAGANDYLSKPIKWAELLRRMQELLNA
jgi:PAS domain S-box-containing protein